MVKIKINDSYYECNMTKKEIRSMNYIPVFYKKFNDFLEENGFKRDSFIFDLTINELKGTAIPIS